MEGLMVLDNYVVRDKTGVVLAKLYDDGRTVRVVRMPSCSLAMYFHILGFLFDLGYRVR